MKKLSSKDAEKIEAAGKKEMEKKAEEGALVDAKNRLETQVGKIPNVLQVYVTKSGGEWMLRVLVVRKLPESKLDHNEIIPKSIGGYKVEVEEIDKVWLSVFKTREIERILEFSDPSHLLEQFKLDWSEDPFSYDEIFHMQAKAANIRFLEDRDIDFMGAVADSYFKILNDGFHEQKRRAEGRVKRSISDMKLAFNLVICMHNVMFYLGVALVIVGILGAFYGKTLAGITLGGVGLADIAFYLIKEPVEGIHESMGNLMQLQAAYRSFLMAPKFWHPSKNMDLYTGYANSNHFDEAKKIAQALHQNTVDTIDLIENYCKLDEPREENEDKSNVEKGAVGDAEKLNQHSSSGKAQEEQ
jgi:hypothetical protein